MERVSTRKAGTRLRGRRLALVAVLSALVAAVPAAQSPVSRPSTAYDLLRKEAERAPGLGDSGAGAFVSLSVLGAGCAVGGVAWALAPHYQKWGPADPDVGIGYPAQGISIAALQALFQTMLVIPFVVDEPRRARDAFAAVQDELDPVARERSAARALQQLARRDRNFKMMGLAAYLGLTGLSIGAYYVGENAVGRNPNAEWVGPGYVATLAAGTALFLFVGAKAPTSLEGAYGEYLRGRGAQGVAP